MSTNKKGLLPKVEILIIIVFFFGFIIWAMSKCNATQEQLQEQAAELAPEEMEEAETPTAQVTTPIDTVVPSANVNNPLTTNGSVANSTLTTTSGTMLYVTIDGLKLRRQPNLKSEVVTEFGLFEQVTFLEEVTEFKDSINLGKEYAYEPWVKVRAKRGQEGWVYGAGVHYHKQKRSGVQ